MAIGQQDAIGQTAEFLVWATLIAQSGGGLQIAGASDGFFELHFRPDGSAEQSRIDRYRVPLASLAQAISHRLG
jgi:hypothetical protein